MVRYFRDTLRANGSRATHYQQSFTTPWVALSWQLSPRENKISQ